MKFKNYHSAIHNFAHSLISIDYRISGRIALNSLIDLNKQNKETLILFDFIDMEISPQEAVSPSSLALLSDYKTWMPEHFISHNCDLSQLEKLQIHFSANFELASSPPTMNYAIELPAIAIIVWKAFKKPEQSFKIYQIELINKDFLETGIPEIK